MERLKRKTEIGRSYGGALALAVAAWLTTGCLGLSKSDNAQPELLEASTGSAGGMAAFQTGFYSFAVTNCSQCHGASQSPLFAVSNVSTAYGYADSSQWIDFTDPAGSVFEARANDGHCGLSNCTGHGAEILPMLQSWASAELSGGGGGGGGPTPTAKYMTPSIPVPTPLPTGATFVPMRWAMSTLAPGNSLVAGSIFEIEVQSLSATSYKIRNPKLVGLASPVLVQGIHIYVRKSTDPAPGTEDPEANYWVNDSVSVQPSPLPTPLPATPMKAPAIDPNPMGVNVLSAQDYFAIGFDNLTPGTLSLPLAPTFSSLNANIFQPMCLSCHGSAAPSGGIDLSSYAAVIGSVNTGTPAQSAIYTAVTSANPLMPEGKAALTAAETSAILTWITDGAPNN